MYVVTLARKPLSESTVAANVLEHGVGALHIDASRGRVVPLESDGRSGRWQANLVLGHRPGCECVGTKVVQSNARPNHATSPIPNDKRRLYGVYTSENTLRPYYGMGGETVTAWACDPECPVAELDSQSGTGGASRFFIQVGGGGSCTS